MGLLIHFVKVLVVVLYRLGNCLLPFQTQWFANCLLKGKHGAIACRFLTLSTDWPDTRGCDTFLHALRSDFSPRKRSKKGKMMGFSQEKGDHPVYFLDITFYYRHDDKTGLHRRIYEILNVLLPAKDIDCRAIYYSPRYGTYQYANLLVASKFPGSPLYEDPVLFHKEDSLVLMQASVPVGVYLKDFTSRGIRVSSVVDDVIPIQHPEMVKSNVRFIHDFRDIMAHSTLVLSVSKTAVEEIRQCAKEHGWEVNPQLHYGCVYNGCDFRKPEETSLSGEEQQLLTKLEGKRFVFAVGTYSPRKGFQEAVDAFSLLWQKGEDLCYVMAGRVGTTTGIFIEDCKRHSEYGRRLFLAVDASDLLLSKLYEKCLFVLNCSHAEGFGIPLMEATFYQKPILARRLPVFEELMKDQARYFDDCDAHQLADYIAQAKRDVESGSFVFANKLLIDYYSWEEVAILFKKAIF